LRAETGSDFELGDRNASGNAAGNDLNASLDSVMEGTRRQAPNNNFAEVNASSYADTAEGGKEVGSGSSGHASGSASASGSVQVGAGK
jgi:hypothetical protein